MDKVWEGFDKKKKNRIVFLPPYLRSETDGYIDYLDTKKKDPIVDYMKMVKQIRRKIKRMDKIKKILG